jgi:hypothetical protein
VQEEAGEGATEAATAPREVAQNPQKLRRLGTRKRTRPGNTSVVASCTDQGAGDGMWLSGMTILYTVVFYLQRLT